MKHNKLNIVWNGKVWPTKNAGRSEVFRTSSALGAMDIINKRNVSNILTAVYTDGLGRKHNLALMGKTIK